MVVGIRTGARYCRAYCGDLRRRPGGDRSGQGVSVSPRQRRTERRVPESAISSWSAIIASTCMKFIQTFYERGFHRNGGLAVLDELMGCLIILNWHRFMLRQIPSQEAPAERAGGCVWQQQQYLIRQTNKCPEATWQ